MSRQQGRVVVYDPSARYYPSNVLPLEQLAHWIAFSRVNGIGPVTFKRLLDFFSDDARAAWQADRKTLASIEGINQKTLDSFLQQRAKIVPEQELERLTSLRIHVITWKDETYPPLLRKMEHPPFVLYVCGNLTADDLHFTIGIVGTRKMTTYGRQATEKLSRDLALGKITIVSGLALGVDTIAHTTALDAGGRTIAVLACGLDTIYPTSNYLLAKRIVESGQGALITTFPLGIKPDANNFPARNHIIAGLSLGILVTEAPAQSGALITATSALSQGREIFAVPHPIFSPAGAGVNKLIQDGACLVTKIDDILAGLNLFMVPEQAATRVILPENTEERTIFALLDQEPRHIDDLICQSELPAHTVSATLTIMELKGMVRSVGHMQYISGMPT